MNEREAILWMREVIADYWSVLALVQDSEWRPW